MKNTLLVIASVLMLAGTASAYPRHRGHRPPPPSNGDASDAFSLGALLGSLSVSSLDCSADYDCKQVLAAQDDAALFIASNGEIRSAALDQALQSLRTANPEVSAKVTDLDLAAAILSAQ